MNAPCTLAALAALAPVANTTALRVQFPLLADRRPLLSSSMPLSQTTMKTMTTTMTTMTTAAVAAVAAARVAQVARVLQNATSIAAAPVWWVPWR